MVFPGIFPLVYLLENKKTKKNRKHLEFFGVFGVWGFLGFEKTKKTPRVFLGVLFLNSVLCDGICETKFALEGFGDENFLRTS